MKSGTKLAGCVLLGALSSAFYCMPSRLAAQAPSNGAGATTPRPVAYPPRPKAPQDVLDRGKATYGVSCAFCHGSDAGGGEVGPNLRRSGIVLEDRNGELIAPIVHGGRVDQGMPRIDITDAQISDIAAWLHSLTVASRTDPNAEHIDIVIGDPKAGQIYFQKTCAACHSVTGDLKGIASRIPNPKMLQQTWLLPGSTNGRGSGNPASSHADVHISPITATVTLADGQKVEGDLNRIDEFYVGITTADGSYRSFSRNGDHPKVELHDPLAPHRELVQKYTDRDIHNLTAYLVTLK